MSNFPKPNHIDYNYTPQAWPKALNQSQRTFNKSFGYETAQPKGISPPIIPNPNLHQHLDSRV